MHHGRKSDRTDRSEFYAVPVFDRRRHVGIAVLQPRPDILERICPDAVFKTVLPGMAARGDDLVLSVDEDGLDPRRAELDAERSLAALDRASDVFHSSSPNRRFFIYHNYSSKAVKFQEGEKKKRPISRKKYPFPRVTPIFFQKTSYFSAHSPYPDASLHLC